MRPKILLVENRLESFSVMGHLFRSRGYEVETAFCYQQAIEIAAASDRSFDVLISDIGLPDRDG